MNIPCDKRCGENPDRSTWCEYCQDIEYYADVKDSRDNEFYGNTIKGTRGHAKMNRITSRDIPDILAFIAMILMPVCIIMAVITE
jgi:hypothetical protein